VTAAVRRIRAHAKVNLGLRVLGRRADGYHELRTCMHAIALHDLLEVESAGGPSTLVLLHDLEPGVPPGLPVAAGDDNLVLRAARAFAARVPGARGARFTLHKRVPAGAGLGGGSSDAAAALRSLNDAAGRPLDAAALHEAARGLGADVPFFLRGGTQWASGIGDVLTPVASAPHWHFLLLVPPFGTSTADVYRTLAAELTMPLAPASIRASDTQSSAGWTVPEDWSNDLEQAARRCAPELGALLDRTRAMVGAGVQMSGSGSCLFWAARARDDVIRARERARALEREGVALVVTESAPAFASAVDEQAAGGG
jgi:4-diphosphocytidyl-2-C-methyl-D-erythritol kinase